VSLELGQLSLVSIIGELLGRKVEASVYKTENTAVGSVTLTTLHPLSVKVGTSFANKRNRSVGIVRSRTQATEVFLYSLLANTDEDLSKSKI
jgi:hypothetical protein